MKKKLFVGILILTMLAACLSAAATAAGGSGTVTGSVTATDFIAAADADGNIRLEDDVTVSDGHIWVGTGAKIVLDLNGHTLNLPEGKSLLVNAGGELTVNDSSEDHSGKIAGHSEAFGVIQVQGAGKNLLTLNGGTVEDKGSFAAVAVTKSAVGSAVRVNGGGISGENTTGILLNGDCTLDFKGGKIALTDGIGIQTNGSADQKESKVNVTGGAIAVENGVAMYLPSKGGVTRVTGGEISAKYGVVVLGGSLTVDGDASITTTGTEKFRVGDSGAEFPASAVVADNAYDGESSEKVNVEINGGSIAAPADQKTVSFTKSGTDGEGEDAPVEITGGVFLAGGKADESVKSFVVEGSEIDKETGRLTASEDAAVLVTGSDGNARGFMDLAGSVAAAKEGETVKLLENAEISAYITVDKSLTIDTDKSSITRTGSGSTVFDIQNGAELTLTGSGTVETAVDSTSPMLNVEKGSLRLNGPTVKRTAGQGVAIQVASSKEEPYNSATVETGTVETAGSTAIVVFENGILNIEGGTVKSADGFAVHTNGSAQGAANSSANAVVRVTGGAVTSEKATAMYLAGRSGETVISGDAAITGGTNGIVVRGGRIVVRADEQGEAPAITSKSAELTGGIGDSGSSQLPRGALVVDRDSDYGDIIGADIQAGVFKAETEGVRSFVYTADGSADAEISEEVTVTGGAFTSNGKADHQVNRYLPEALAVGTGEGHEGEVAAYENAVKAFGYGATRQEAVAALTAAVNDQDKADAIAAATNDWGDQTMFILFEKPIPAYKTVTFTVTNGEYAYTDTCEGGETGTFNLFAWSFLNKSQTPAVAAMPGEWTLSFAQGVGIDLNGHDAARIPELETTVDGRDVVNFAKLTEGAEVEDEAMTVTVKTDESAGQYYEVRFDTRKLPQSTGTGEGATEQYWLGWALQAPGGAARMTVAKGGAANAVGAGGETKDALEPMTVGDKPGYALYYKANDPGSGKTWVRVTWLDEEGRSLGTTFIHVVFGDITFARPDGAEIAPVEGGSGFKADKSDAEAAIKAVWEDIRTGESSPDDVIGNTLWAIFRLEAPSDPGVGFSYRVKRNDQVIYTSEEDVTVKDGLLLYFSLDGQLKPAAPGRYVLEVLSNGLPVANEAVEVYKVTFTAGEGIKAGVEPVTVYTDRAGLTAAKAVPSAFELAGGMNRLVTSEEVSGDGYTVSITVTGTYDAPAPGPGPSPAVTAKVENTENGSVKLSSTTARAGSRVTVTVAPDRGYEVGEVTVTDKNGGSVALTENGDGTYTFTMPTATPVTVRAVFNRIDASSMFVDVAADRENWYLEELQELLVDHPDLINGDLNAAGERVFRPHEGMTRAEFAKILYVMAGAKPVEVENPFTDVPENEWYRDYILWAYNEGIMLGNGDGTVTPEDAITRDQAVAMLNRYLGGLQGERNDSLDLFRDAADVEEFAREAMNWAVENDIIRGDDAGRIEPTHNIERCEMAAILVRVFRNVID